MENTHDVHYLIQSTDGTFMRPLHNGEHAYTQYPNHAEFFERFDLAKRIAGIINDRNRQEGSAARVRVIRREVYRTYDESIDQFPTD